MRVYELNRTCFNRNAFIFVRNFHIMNVHVKAPNVDAIQATLITTTYDEIVHLTTLHSIQNQMESRCWISVRQLKSSGDSHTNSQQGRYHELRS